MLRLLIFILLHTVADALLIEAFPKLATGRRRWLFWGVSAAAGLSWVLAILLTGAPDAEAGLLEVGLRLTSTWWLLGVVGVVGLLAPLVGWRWWSAWRGGPEHPGDPSRRAILAKSMKVAPAVAGVGAAAGLLGGSSGFQVRTNVVRIPDLPEALEGFRIGQTTDVHLGVFVGVDRLQRGVAALDEAGVDLQVMTGDLLDDLSMLDGAIAALDSCRAEHGMYAILGNHEYWHSPERIVAAYKPSKTTLLVDESALLSVGGAALRLVGVDYPLPRNGRTELMKRSAERSFTGVDSAAETVVCLSHHPDFFPFAARNGADLTLCGHTHGGQFSFFGLSAFFWAFRYVYGAYQTKGRHVYVSGGTGHWLPIRLGVPTEVTVHELRRA